MPSLFTCKIGGEGHQTTMASSKIAAPAEGATDRHTRTTPDGTGERVDLAVTGMTCAACARRIERKLSRTPGVNRAGVNFATSRATVEYDPQATGVHQLIEAVKEVGYGTA